MNCLKSSTFYKGLSLSRSSSIYSLILYFYQQDLSGGEQNIFLVFSSPVLQSRYFFFSPLASADSVVSDLVQQDAVLLTTQALLQAEPCEAPKVLLPMLWKCRNHERSWFTMLLLVQLADVYSLTVKPGFCSAFSPVPNIPLSQLNCMSNVTLYFYAYTSVAYLSFVCCPVRNCNACTLVAVLCGVCAVALPSPRLSVSVREVLQSR